MILQFIETAPLWQLAVLSFALMLGSWEVGRLLQARLARQLHKDDVPDEGYILSGILGLLALLIAFTFGLALDRYETRRELVVTEANALGTAWLRTSLIDNPAPLRAALKDYAKARVAFSLANASQLSAAHAAANAKQEKLWAEAVAALGDQRTTALASTVLAPINEAIDTAATRAAALDARLPASVALILGLYALISAGMLGYVVAKNGGNQRAASLLLFMMVTLSFLLIEDLDRARDGAIQVPQQPMLEALAAMT